MAKLITMFLVLIAIQACLLLYAGPKDITNDNDVANTSLWDFVTNIDRWNSLDFVLTIFGVAGAIALAGIVAGQVFSFKSDFLLLAVLVPGLITIGVVFTNLANVLRKDLSSAVCGIGHLTDCTPVNWLVAITIAPIAFFYVWTVIEWWRGKDY